MYLVWKSGRSNSSAFVILCSSVLGENSYGVFWMRFQSLWLYLVLWMNSRIGTSTGCRNSCATISGQLVYVKGLGQGAKFIHLGDGFIISKDALEVSTFNTISVVKKERWGYLELMY